eukprot:7378005-Prymnesium_polylepis.2
MSNFGGSFRSGDVSGREKLDNSRLWLRNEGTAMVCFSSHARMVFWVVQSRPERAVLTIEAKRWRDVERATVTNVLKEPLSGVGGRGLSDPEKRIEVMRADASAPTALARIDSLQAAFRGCHRVSWLICSCNMCAIDSSDATRGSRFLLIM